MATKRPTKAPPSRADRAAKGVEYRAWKVRALADLANRHDVKADIIPERLWRRLYIQGRSARWNAGAAHRPADTSRRAAVT
jgi:hypothetical protein